MPARPGMRDAQSCRPSPFATVLAALASQAIEDGTGSAYRPLGPANRAVAAMDERDFVLAMPRPATIPGRTLVTGTANPKEVSG